MNDLCIMPTLRQLVQRFNGQIERRKVLNLHLSSVAQSFMSMPGFLRDLIFSALASFALDGV